MGAGGEPHTLDRRGLGAQLLSLSAHKLGGPAGVGALIVDASLPLQPLLRGGGQEARPRAGTENLLGIAGFGMAAARASTLPMPPG
ncbi:MAG: aminotransferase class V-fold PLP-dependent enzyme [Rhodospirillales bacterium]